MPAQGLAVPCQPIVGLFAADLEQVLEEAAVGVDLAGDAQRLPGLFVLNHLELEMLESPLVVEAVLDHAGDEGDGAHFAHER